MERQGKVWEVQWRFFQYLICGKGFIRNYAGTWMTQETLRRIELLGLGSACSSSWLCVVMHGIGCWPQVPCRCAGAGWLECGPTLRDSHQPGHSTCRNMDKGQLCIKLSWAGLCWSPLSTLTDCRLLACVREKRCGHFSPDLCFHNSQSGSRCLFSLCAVWYPKGSDDPWPLC